MSEILDLLCLLLFALIVLAFVSFFKGDPSLADLLYGKVMAWAATGCTP